LDISDKGSIEAQQSARRHEGFRRQANPGIRPVLVSLVLSSVCALSVLAVWRYQDSRLNSLRRSIDSNKLTLEQQIGFEKDLIQIEFEGRTAIAQAVLGLTVLASLYFNWRNLRLTATTLQTTQKGQITERFTRAIDQLGTTNANGEPKLEIRLGGIYSLGEIAKEGSEYSQPVVQVLTAYVRMHAPYSIHGSDGPDTGASRELTPTFDVQAVLNVIGSSMVSGIDLRATQLTGADLRGAFLIRANLSHTQMRRVRFGNAQLQEADLSYANLTHADLRSAELQGAKLSYAVLPDDLSGAHLHGANLRAAKLKGRELMNADLREADLGAETNLEGANLSGADLRGAQFDSSCLKNVNLRGAKLAGANLASASLERCRMQGVNLRETQGLTWEQISHAFINPFTQLPSDVGSAMPPVMRTALERLPTQFVGIGLRGVDVVHQDQNGQPTDPT
jgi:uncharacterized protein YjbI with pentapeptide repeats